MNIDNFASISDLNVLICGDLMVDKYIIGDVKRISPEAPVPILEIVSQESKLGGAGNVINNVTSLGAKTRVLGCIGEDFDGKWIKNQLSYNGTDVTFLGSNSNTKTITKTRLVSRNQQFLRLDDEKIKDIPFEYEEYLSANIQKVFSNINVLIISDYAKGTITKTLAQLLINYANQNNIPIVVDPKGKDFSKYNNATVCTPNMNELNFISGHTLVNEDDVVEQSTKLLKDINLSYLALTRSEKGISLISKSSFLKQDFPATAKDVIDVTGAGDTVVSIIAICLALNYTMSDCCILANIAASIVCSKFGAATITVNELLKSIFDNGEHKLIDIKSAKYIVANLKEQGKKVIFTNGCFDILHAGHISSFKQAKAFGDVLIIAVNSDASIRKIKGDTRPIINEENRIAMLCALEIVDYVVLMVDDNPSNIIDSIKPDIAVKGKDWEGKDVPEKSIIEAYGGTMKFINLEQGLSTTNIINKIILNNQ